jgi:t-SNARE complex subunit (syntaxin)
MCLKIPKSVVPLLQQQLNVSQTATVAKRARVFFPEASEEEIHRQIAHNPLGYARDALLRTQEAAHEDVHLVVAEVESRARDVEMLSASIAEVQEMFRDFTMLIAEQHEDIDTISDTVSGWGLRLFLGRFAVLERAFRLFFNTLQVEEACARVQNGNTQMQRAIYEQRKAR